MLSDRLRGELYRLVAASDHPLSRDEAAAAAGMPRSTAAFHLDRLVEAGAAGGRAPPPQRAIRSRSRAPDEALPRDARRGDRRACPSGTTNSPASCSPRPSSAPSATASGTRDALTPRRATVGLGIGRSHTALEDALTRCGYAPAEDGSGGLTLENCPFHALATRHTPLVCGANLALVQGVVEATGDERMPVARALGGKVLRRDPPARRRRRRHPDAEPVRTDIQRDTCSRVAIMGLMTAPRILVVDDEPNIRDLLITSLRFAGFQVKAVSNGAQTISAVLEEEPDLIILDVMLPDMNGFSVTKRLRGAGYTAPILFLTAKDETEDKITGLNAGGDDYVTKPFSLDEIVARIQAILRRTMQADEESMIRAGELTMDQDTHEVLVGDALDRPEPDRVQAAALPDAEPQPRAVEGADPRPRVGVRLQRRRRHRRELHLLPAPQDRSALRPSR